MARHTKQSISVKKKSKSIDWAEALLIQIKDFNALDIPISDSNPLLPLPIKEHRFHPVRKWRFDLAFIDHSLAVEIEGGIWLIGRHNRGAGFIKDMEKYNTATLFGWKLLRFSPKDVNTGDALLFLRHYFKGDKKIE
jgi:hypothetical protein